MSAFMDDSSGSFVLGFFPMDLIRHGYCQPNNDRFAVGTRAQKESPHTLLICQVLLYRTCFIAAACRVVAMMPVCSIPLPGGGDAHRYSTG
jgi:hypothetical protein